MWRLTSSGLDSYNVACDQFVNRATNSNEFVVGNGLRSCTSEIQVSAEFAVDGDPVRLIDTPGFNDTTIEDAEILEKISAFLATVSVIYISRFARSDLPFRYKHEVKLAGVIYFHRISDERWRRSDTRSFGWLRRICGEDTLRNVVLMTNMWGNVNPKVGAAREKQLAAEFVRPALDKGAQLLRNGNTTESAHEIIRVILRNHRSALQVQQELIDEGRKFDQTTVGKGISEELREDKNKLERQLEALENELRRMQAGKKGERVQMEAEIVTLREKIEEHDEKTGNMNEDYEEKEAETDRQWSPFILGLVGGIISCMLLLARFYFRL